MLKEGNLLIQECKATESTDWQERGAGCLSCPAWLQAGLANHSLGSNPARGSVARKQRLVFTMNICN